VNDLDQVPRVARIGRGSCGSAQQDVVRSDIGVDECVAGQGPQPSISQRAEFVQMSCGPRVKIGGGISGDAVPASEVLGE
ncbi:MAG: hypothetical protein ACRDQZ_09890, partial [Mycobacteriales bacterium]